MSSQATASGGRLIKASKWNEFHPWPTQAGLRWMIFNESTNGFDQVVKRVGKTVLVDEAAFFRWVDAQNQKAMTGGR